MSRSKVNKDLFRSIWMQLATVTCWLLWSGYSEDHQKANVGEIRGKITVASKDDEIEGMLRGRDLSRYDRYSHSLSKPTEPYRISEKAVVYIDSVQGDGLAKPPDVHPQLIQRDLLFRPLVLPVIVGTTVDFPNKDDLFHNVFSYSGPKEFDLGRYPKGQKKSVTFDTPGIVSVYCDIHSYMSATILVLGHPFFASPDDDGDYSISRVPPGKYKLSFWYGRKKVETRKITVRAGETTTMNFEY